MSYARKMLSFTSITKHNPGLIASLLFRSYAQILESEPEYWEREKENWFRYDYNVFQNIDKHRNCIFVTCINTEVIGFASFYQTRNSKLGLIGHNCILPEFCGHGYGKQQISEILERYKNLGVKRIVVKTNAHPFFIPAQKMYLSCGFRETKRAVGGLDPRYEIIEYERKL